MAALPGSKGRCECVELRGVREGFHLEPRTRLERCKDGKALAAHVYPVLGNQPISAVDTATVLRSLQPIWAKTPAMASRVRSMIEAVLNSAKARGLREGQNPAQWRGHLDHLLPSRIKIRRVQHHMALPFAEIPAFMAELRARDDLSSRALEFLILTASRSGEGRALNGWRLI